MQKKISFERRKNTKFCEYLLKSKTTSDPFIKEMPNI